MLLTNNRAQQYVAGGQYLVLFHIGKLDFFISPFVLSNQNILIW